MGARGEGRPGKLLEPSIPGRTADRARPRCTAVRGLAEHDRRERRRVDTRGESFDGLTATTYALQPCPIGFVRARAVTRLATFGRLHIYIRMRCVSRWLMSDVGERNASGTTSSHFS